MLIVYASRTGNVKKFVASITKYPVVNIYDYESSMGKYVLITYSDGWGEVPPEVSSFLKIHSDNMVGVCASGRQHWKLFGTYCKAADVIHEQYGVPILLKFEMIGSDKDRAELIERIEGIE